MQSNVNRAKDSRYSRSHYFIWSITNFWLLRDLKNLLTGTTSSHQCSQQSKTLSLDITKPYNLLLSENTSKFYIWKTKVYLQNTTVHISHTELNSYFKSWTKFSDKITVSQPSKLPPHWDLLFSVRLRSGCSFVESCHMHVQGRKKGGTTLFLQCRNN